MSKLMQVMPGDLYEIGDVKYRVFFVQDGLVSLIAMSKVDFKNIEIDDFSKNVLSGNFIKVTEEKRLSVPIMSNEQEIKASKREAIIKTVLEDVYPAWSNISGKGKAILPSVYDAAAEVGLTVPRFRTLLYKYLRTGFDRGSLINMRYVKTVIDMPKRVKNTLSSEKTLNKKYALNWAWEIFKQKPNVARSFELMIEKFYTTYDWENVEGGGMKQIAIISDDAPSKDTLYRYIKKRLPEGMTVSMYKKGQKEVLNNNRFLTGTQRSGLVSCGQLVQADECEIPINLVDEYGNVIGKPILYLFFDPYSYIIVSAYVGFVNNAIDGPINLLLNMCEPHNRQSEKYGVYFAPDEFPSMFIPKEIRCDQGAEWMSNHMRRIAAEFGITLSPVPAGVGSLKGGVENAFFRIQSRLLKQHYDEGYIFKTHGGAKAAKKSACMTLDSFRKIMYLMIRELNTSPLGDTYAPVKKELIDGVDPIPSKLWKYYTDGKFSPVSVTESNKDQIIFSLLWNDKSFKLGRDGISYKNTPLCWFKDVDWFKLMLRTKNPELEVRYDNTDLSHVYLKYKGVIHKIGFSFARDDLKSYAGWTWAAFEDYWKEYERKKKDLKKLSLENRLAVQHESRDIMATNKAVMSDMNLNEDNIPGARAIAKVKLETSPDEAKNRMLDINDDAEDEDVDVAVGAEEYNPVDINDLIKQIHEDEDV